MFSFSNIESTDHIVGLSSGFCWTHKRPTWMHRSASEGWNWSSNAASINSNAFSSSQSFHAWRFHNLELVYELVWSVDYKYYQAWFATMSIVLTCPRRFSWCSVWKKPLFFLPLTISKRMTPKLKTSDFNEKHPSSAYSGDI